MNSLTCFPLHMYFRWSEEGNHWGWIQINWVFTGILPGLSTKTHQNTK